MFFKNRNEIQQLDQCKEKCHEVFRIINDLIGDDIPNKDLSYPMDVQSINNISHARREQRRRFYIFDTQHLKMVTARYWFVLPVFLLLVARQMINKKDQNIFFISLYYTLILIICMKLYQAVFNSIPFQSFGRFFFKRNQRKSYETLLRFYKLCYQVERVAMPSLWRDFLLDEKLRLAMCDSQINSPCHVAMLSGLYSIKYRTFDCVAISALVILKLIEDQVPFRIERLSRRHGPNDPQPEYVHSFVMVNRTRGDIQNIDSLNDDCRIVDLWYKVDASIKEIKDDPLFFVRYPLLHLSDKIIAGSFFGNNPPHGYKLYLEKFRDFQNENDYQRTISRDMI